MPRYYNYRLAQVDDKVRRCELKEPFVKCVAIYKTEYPVFDAMIDGFKVDSIQQSTPQKEEVEITASGSATVENMKTSDIDGSLTIRVGFYVAPIQRQPTVSVTLTDSDGKTFTWKRSNEEGRF